MAEMKLSTTASLPVWGSCRGEHGSDFCFKWQSRRRRTRRGAIIFLGLFWKAWHNFCTLWRSPPSFCLPSACTFRGFCWSASSSSALNTAVAYAPSIKGSNHQWSRGLVWNRAELLHPVRYIYIWATAGESSSLPVFSCVLSLCLLCCITSIRWGFWTGQLPVWALGLKISLDIHNLLVDSVCLDLLGSFNVWIWHLTSFNYEYEAG